MANKYDLMINIGGKLNSSLANATSGANKALSGMQRNANLLKTALGAALGVGSIMLIKKAGQALFDTAEKASDLTEAQNVVTSTFKNSSSSVLAWTDSISMVSGISKTAATSMVGSMGAMLKSSRLAESSAASMSEQLVQLTGDMASFYNLDSETAWEKIRSGIAGETEPLKQLGINMSVANLEAYALSQGISKSFSSMSQAEQTTLRYNYLMSVTADAQGDFAKTSGGMANQMRIAKMQIENVVTTVGSKFLPIFNSALRVITTNIPKISPVISSVTDKVVGKFIGNILPVITNVYEAVKNNMAQISAVIGTAFNVIKIVISAAFTVIKTVFTFISDHLTLFETLAASILAVVAAITIWKGVTMAISAVTKAFTAVQAALNIVMAMNPIVLIILAIVALVAAIVVLWNKCDAFRNFFLGIWTKIKSIFNAVVTFIKGNWQSLLLFLVNPLAGAFKLLWDHSEKFRNFWINLWAGIKNVVAGIGAWFGTVFTGAWNAIKNAFSAVGTFFSGIWNTITGIFTTIGTTIGNAIGGAFKSVINAIIGFAEGMINDFLSGINMAIGVINKIPGVEITPLSLLSIPRLAEGGIIQHQPGGILANIGEGKYDEAVIPLKNKGGLGGSNITYAPVQYFQGSVCKADIEEANAVSFEQFKRFMQKYEADRKRKCFA